MWLIIFAVDLQRLLPIQNVDPVLQPAKLELYCNAIADAGSHLSNCFGFLDRTVRQISNCEFVWAARGLKT